MDEEEEVDEEDEKSEAERKVKLFATSWLTIFATIAFSIWKTDDN